MQGRDYCFQILPGRSRYVEINDFIKIAIWLLVPIHSLESVQKTFHNPYYFFRAFATRLDSLMVVSTVKHPLLSNPPDIAQESIFGLMDVMERDESSTRDHSLNVID